MARKILILADPGIDTAFAIALALHDPALEVLGLIPTAGNVSAEQATANMQVLIDQLDPARWPRTASALPVEYDTDGTTIHGANGLGGVVFPMASKHQQLSADKAIIELVRAFPGDVSIVVLGPLTTLAHTIARDPELPGMIDTLIFVGGAYREPGNAGPHAEFHAWLDPDSTRAVLQAGLHPIVIPLDVTRRLILSPTELLTLPNPDSRTGQFLR
ncbi:MAG: nucleoside hydrolase, partial [Gemmataceae bacterium]